MIKHLFPEKITPILPAVYDDALSYVEQLMLIYRKANELVDIVNDVRIDFKKLNDDFVQLSKDNEAFKNEITNTVNGLSAKVEQFDKDVKDALNKLDENTNKVDEYLKQLNVYIAEVNALNENVNRYITEVGELKQQASDYKDKIDASVLKQNSAIQDISNYVGMGYPYVNISRCIVISEHYGGSDKTMWDLFYQYGAGYASTVSPRIKLNLHGGFAGAFAQIQTGIDHAFMEGTASAIQPTCYIIECSGSDVEYIDNIYGHIKTMYTDVDPQGVAYYKPTIVFVPNISNCYANITDKIKSVYVSMLDKYKSLKDLVICYDAYKWIYGTRIRSDNFYEVGTDLSYNQAKTCANNLYATLRGESGSVYYNVEGVKNGSFAAIGSGGINTTYDVAYNVVDNFLNVKVTLHNAEFTQISEEETYLRNVWMSPTLLTTSWFLSLNEFPTYASYYASAEKPVKWKNSPVPSDGLKNYTCSAICSLNDLTGISKYLNLSVTAKEPSANATGDIVCDFYFPLMCFDV